VTPVLQPTVCSEAGVAFDRTSTGYGFVRQPGGMYAYARATVRHLELMREHSKGGRRADAGQFAARHVAGRGSDWCYGDGGHLGGSGEARCDGRADDGRIHAYEGTALREDAEEDPVIPRLVLTVE
jgi:hypothetical protein